MKISRIHFTLAALTFAALNLAFAQRAHADRQTRAEAIAILTSGEWHFQGKNLSDTRLFDPKGTMTRHGSGYKETKATWKVDYKQVTITFSYFSETLMLPIDPKGTQGIDPWGDDFTATMTGPPPAPVATPTPVPTGLEALKVLNKPSATPTPAISLKEQIARTTALLTTRKWTFTGSNWTDKRTFAADGTLTVDSMSAAQSNHWQIVGNQIIMTFPDRKEILNLPLDPKGTSGKDAYGLGIMAVQESDPKDSAGSSGGSYFGSSEHGIDTPAPNSNQ